MKFSLQNKFWEEDKGEIIPQNFRLWHVHKSALGGMLHAPVPPNNKKKSVCN